MSGSSSLSSNPSIKRPRNLTDRKNLRIRAGLDVAAKRNILAPSRI
jgi:hypothetical protein